MDLNAILTRINQRAEALGLSERQVSIRSGMSADGVRNWRRRGADEDSAGANMASLEKIARTLDVSVTWLLTGKDAAMAAPAGMAEDAKPFVGRAAQSHEDPVRALFGASCRNPAVTHIAARDMPGIGVFAGDMIICDVSRPPDVGEIAVAVARQESGENGAAFVRYYLPPYLADGDALTRERPIHIDKDDILVRYPVIGIIRGVKQQGD